MCVCVCRYLYGIGTLCSSEQAPTASTAQQAAQASALAAQCSWGWLLRRWLIRHNDVVLGVACFAAALQAPSALGLLLSAGTLITALQHGFANHSSAMSATRRWHRRSVTSLRSTSGASGTSMPRSGQHRQQHPASAPAGTSSLQASDQARAFKAECAASQKSLAALMDAVTALLQVLVAAWLLAQYLLQVAWFRDLIMAASPPLLPWLLLWLGLPVAGNGPTEVPQLTMESMLRMKALVLVATALRRKAQRWQQALPQAVVAAADASWPCPLFWPPSGADTGSESGAHLTGAAGHSGLSGQLRQGAAAGQDARAGAESLPWEELEPVLRRAGALMSPVKALLFRVSEHLSQQRGCCRHSTVRIQMHVYSQLSFAWSKLFRLYGHHLMHPCCAAAALLHCWVAVAAPSRPRHDPSVGSHGPARGHSTGHSIHLQP